MGTRPRAAGVLLTVVVAGGDLRLRLLWPGVLCQDRALCPARGRGRRHGQSVLSRTHVAIACGEQRAENDGAVPQPADSAGGIRHPELDRARSHASSEVQGCSQESRSLLPGGRRWATSERAMRSRVRSAPATPLPSLHGVPQPVVPELISPGASGLCGSSYFVRPPCCLLRASPCRFVREIAPSFGCPSGRKSRLGRWGTPGLPRRAAEAMDGPAQPLTRPTTSGAQKSDTSPQNPSKLGPKSPFGERPKSCLPREPPPCKRPTQSPASLGALAQPRP